MNAGFQDNSPNFYATVLKAYYRYHNPKLVGNVDKVLVKWKGQETELLRRCSLKYGEHPLDFWAMQPSQNSPLKQRDLARPHTSSGARVGSPVQSGVRPSTSREVYSTRGSNGNTPQRSNATTPVRQFPPQNSVIVGSEPSKQTPPSRQSLPRLAVVLDLDETLVHTTDISGQYSSAQHGSPALRSAQPESFVVTVNGETLLVRKRPGVDEFLAQAAALFDLYVYTAGEEDYAAEVLSKLDPSGRIFRSHFYRSSCIHNVSSGEYLKDLNIVPGMNLRRGVLVDNNPISFSMQPNNGILIESFYSSATDQELRVLFDVLCHIDKNCEDVRKFLGPLRV